MSAAALTGDSAANVAAWEGHQSKAHLRGIVAGLFVEPDGNNIKVNPGAAIDSDGRMLLVDHDLTHDISKEIGEWFAVWLRLVVETVAAPVSDLQRYLETSRLEVSAMDDFRDAGESTASSGVLLAYVQRDTTNGSVLKIDSCCRRYVGAVGNRIDAPSGRAQIVLGPQFPRDPRRFAFGVQAAATQPIRDVFTWESTGTIRLSARTAVDLQEKKEKTDEVEQPPLLIVGAPTVYFTPEDILDPCQVWTRLTIKSEDEKGALPDKLLALLSDSDMSALATRPACRVALQSLLLRSLNRLIRRAADNVLHLVTRRKFEPAAETVVVDENGNEFTVSNVHVATKTFDIVGVDGTSRNGVSWDGFWPRDWSLSVFPTGEKLPVDVLQMLSCWRALPGDYMCRVLLDHFLGDAIKPLGNPAPRGLYFNGSVPMEQEPPASRIHLVEFKKDGQTFRQLRITIPDPGKENNQHRYRCSIGTALGCTHEPAPTPTEKNWNRQTSWPRGILSVLADKSIDIHNQLNVYPSDGSILPGLILKLEPDSDSGSAAGASGGAASVSPIPATQILGNAVIWDGQRVNRPSRTVLSIGGSLRNLTDLPIEKLRVLVSIYGKDDTGHGPAHTEIVSDGKLGRRPSDIGLTTLAQDVNVPIPEAFKSKTINVSLLVMGVNSQNFIICTQYIDELPAPAA